MSKYDLDRVRQFATQFRQACEEYALITDDHFFRKFPEYCCGYASEMLECYLIKNGVKNLKHVIGEKPHSQETHAWTKLEDNLIIDITLDQFSKSFPSVYIGEPLPIHNEFRNRRERKSDSEIGNYIVEGFYSSILYIIKKSYMNNEL